MSLLSFRYTCSHCEKVFGRGVDLQRHLSAVHGLGECVEPHLPTMLQ